MKEFEGVTNTDEAFAQFCLQVETHIFALLILLYLKKVVTKFSLGYFSSQVIYLSPLYFPHFANTLYYKSLQLENSW